MVLTIRFFLKKIHIFDAASNRILKNTLISALVLPLLILKVVGCNLMKDI